MRSFYLLPAALLASLTSALQLPDLQSFVQALPNALQDLLPEPLHNGTAHELLKRQYSNTCPEDFKSCANLGASNLCCHSKAVCSADYAGHVACCPSGAACTGTIGGVITAGTLNSNGAIVGGGAAATGTTGNAGVLETNTAQTTTTSFQFASSTTNGLVMATTPSTVALATNNNGGFIVDGTSTVANPNAGARIAEVPFLVQAVIRILERLPL
ncbi:uncharacterized protein MYCFIDRAFT_192272 [Pseudocercospora fijiensis CIRAD86]|uniref:Hydrophobin n=1 Tax=Pseudocercospora fijiensis (strain CIRAD86) TaxID=383855 RepID=N1Q6I7_PSEFD|nr:uncharacterized protein MYCFIDRAFT_192272 [Pseudocercospora fijiensis CIRAD86]EME87999.1 hypothetical protein MYCFIDRAFT_192272 [Pseudocercospora fijiensis CIRAD86]